MLHGNTWGRTNTTPLSGGSDPRTPRTTSIEHLAARDHPSRSGPNDGSQGGSDTRAGSQTHTENMNKSFIQGEKAAHFATFPARTPQNAHLPLSEAMAQDIERLRRNFDECEQDAVDTLAELYRLTPKQAWGLWRKHTPMQVRIINKSRHPDPAYATTHSAGVDLRANLEEPVVLHPGQRALIPTGIYLELPE